MARRQPISVQAVASARSMSTVFDVRGEHSQHRGPPVAEHFRFGSLEELFNSATAEAFHSSPHFRAELLRCAPAVKCMFATQSFEKADGESWAFANEPEIQDCRREGVFDAIHDSNRDQLEAVLLANIGAADAPTAEEFVAAFVRTCGKRRRGMFTSLVGAPPQNALEWHQDWGPPDADSLTVMLAFPSADYVGADLGQGGEEGVLTELVSLSHQFSMEFWRQTNFPLHALTEGEEFTDDEARAFDRKGWQALGVADVHRQSPLFARERELLVYRDSDHLHRSPAGCARAAIWRFQ